MKDRINFLEKGKYVLTYKKMAVLVVVWFLICFSIFMVQNGYSWYLGKSLKKHELKLLELKTKQEQIMAMLKVETLKVAEPEVKKLSQVFEHFPTWSQVLTTLSKLMPSQLWMTNIVSTYHSEETMSRRLEISGTGQNPASISNLVQELNKSAIFKNVVLNKTTRVDDEKKRGYSFILLGEVNFGAKEWE